MSIKFLSTVYINYSVPTTPTEHILGTECNLHQTHYDPLLPTGPQMNCPSNEETEAFALQLIQPQQKLKSKTPPSLRQDFTVVQASLELTETLQPQPPECRDDRNKLPRAAKTSKIFFF